ncbi:Alpha/Beta hydrolase protein [Spinellus fusiger]|nr:Alpha/Beta hydrolase protein [Spinellus fusiger]
MTSHVSGSSDRIQAHSLSTTDDKKELSSSIKLGPSPSSTQLNFQDSSPSPQKNRQCSSQVWALLQSRHSSRTHLTRGRRYGFSQHDIDESSKVTLQNNEEEKKKVAAKKSILKKGSEKTRHIIHSVNFGDKNFGSRWMQDTFEDVAMSYPLVDTFVGMVVSRQTRALVRALIKLANAFGQGFKVTGLQLLKAMLVLQKYYQLLPEPAPEPLILDRDILKDSRHYFNYALIAYGWRGLVYLGAYGQYIRGARHRRSNRMAIINYLQIPPEDLLGYEYGLRKGAAFQPSYFLAIDRSRKAIVLSIRGTWSLYDAITDLVCLYKPWKNGLVHSGMLASAQWFYTEIVPQIFRYIHLNRNYVSAFIITGHSLGGGAASLLTMMVVDHLEELRKVSCNPNFMLRCYSYAPVALSSHQLGSLYDRFIFSFICQDDIVGRLSYGTAMELKELVMDTIGAYRALGGWRKVSY